MPKTLKVNIKAHNSMKTRTDTVRKIVPILGVKIDSSHGSGLLKRAQSWVALGTNDEVKRGYFITTPNPEIIARATYDSKLLSSLNSSDLALPDGIGIIAGMKYLSLVGVVSESSLLKKLGSGLIVGSALLFNRRWLTSESEVVPGRIFMEALISEAKKAQNSRIFLLGAKPGVAEAAANKLSDKHGIEEIKSSSGPWLNEDGMPEIDKDKETEVDVISEINAFKPNLLFVAFGPPKQEKWLSRNLPRLNVNVAMVVGGSFDYLAGIVPTPPRMISDAGFEWLWRLITQPSRFKRIFNAVVVFPFKLFINSL